jgi:hypothetical protein
MALALVLSNIHLTKFKAGLDSSPVSSKLSEVGGSVFSAADIMEITILSARALLLIILNVTL